jgi:chromosome segregation ATPase
MYENEINALLGMGETKHERAALDTAIALMRAASVPPHDEAAELAHCERTADAIPGVGSWETRIAIRGAILGQRAAVRAKCAAEPTDEDLKRHIRDKDRYRELLGRAEAEIERLKSLSDGLARAVATLVADNSTLQTELTELAAEIERLKAQLSGVGMQEFRRLEGRLHNAQDEIERLREVWRLAEKQVETLLRQKSELQIEIERLKASRAGFEGRLAAAQLEIERLKAEIKRPEAEPAAAHNPYDLYDRAEDGRRIPRTGGE